MFKTQVVGLSCWLLFFLALPLSAQEKKIVLSPSEIGMNQYFKITISIENERLKNYSQFPEIEGFVKRGTSSSTSTSFVNGRMTSSQSITQNYQPTKQGTFNLSGFTMTINGEKVQAEPFTVKVTAPKSQPQSTDPFDRIRNRNTEPTEFVDVEADAFLALSTDKKEVYVGEGFTTTLAFYVASSNKADMRFYELGKQITEIVKRIKPENCWEENFNIDNINGEPVTINNRSYTQYKIYQATFYPLNLDDISFPSVGLKLIKYQVAKNPSFFGRNRKEDFETFYSRPKEVKVVDLPPHPLKDRVAVGDFQMAEKINTLDLRTGESFNYTFNVLGEGNISSIEAPLLPESEDFDFYAPNVKQDVTRSAGRVRGTKSFSYYGIPNEPGSYELGDYFKWIYFNPETEKYDTLASKQVLNVTGESRKNEYILSNDMGTFYDGIEFTDNELRDLDGNSWMKIFVNLFILTMLTLTVVFFIRK